MFFPIRTDIALRDFPWMNWVLLGANILIYAIQRGVDPATWPVLEPTDLRLWNFFSYAFLHADGLHLFGNMLFLYIFGGAVNDRLGHVGYLGFYLAGGVFSALGHMTVSSAPVLGASGSVAAVTGAFLALFPRSYVTIIYFFIVIGHFPILSLYLIVFFFVKEIYFHLAEEGNIAHMAHIAGTVYGFLIVMLLLWWKMLPRSWDDMLSIIEQRNRRRRYHETVRDGYNPFGAVPRTPRKDDTPSAETQRILEIRATISEAIAHHKPEEAATLFLELLKHDSSQVLSRQAQLDVANALAGQQKYQEAADAYERFLATYPTAANIQQIHLMLGLIYARYLRQQVNARVQLQKVIDRTHSGREADLAREELARLGSSAPPPLP